MMMGGVKGVTTTSPTSLSDGAGLIPAAMQGAGLGVPEGLRSAPDGL